MVQAVLRTTEFPQLLLYTVSMSRCPAFADEEVAALVVDNGGMAGFCRLRCTSRCPFDSGKCKAVPAHHAVFPLIFGRSKIFGIMWVWSRRTVVRAQARGVYTGAVLGRVHVPGWWSPWWFHRCSSWTSWCAFVVHWQVSWRGCYCSSRYGRRHPCRGAWHPIDKVVDVPSHAATGSSCHS